MNNLSLRVKPGGGVLPGGHGVELHHRLPLGAWGWGVLGACWGRAGGVLGISGRAGGWGAG